MTSCQKIQHKGSKSDSEQVDSSFMVRCFTENLTTGCCYVVLTNKKQVKSYEKLIPENVGHIRCHECQIHGDVVHVPPEALHQTVTSWPFAAWGLDVIGLINPPSSKGNQYILAVTDYFCKWTEAIALRNVKEKDVVNFIRHVIIYRHGIPKKIVTDNSNPFKNRDMEKLCQKFGIHYLFSTPYYPPVNGLVEVFNKTIMRILKRTVTRNKRDWDERLQEALLWVYRTTHRTATSTTPYSLVYGVKAVIPIEIRVTSLRVVVHQSITNDENVKIRLKELDLLDKKRLAAQ
ncbi:uncharacterized protein LOC131226577 [Magnolia sinica]|uniref:uncharacterized protein LOC131226577 n=1 Tax=Magnolia sinica TaxID=86752 RepID=UPI00265866FE|nr:uncharacterized protein LOC131226577 [Magnolia sinica]